MLLSHSDHFHHLRDPLYSTGEVPIILASSGFKTGTVTPRYELNAGYGYRTATNTTIGRQRTTHYFEGVYITTL
jgi:hypothetical protein